MPNQDAPALLYVQTDVDPEAEATWNRWYNTRHLPQRLAVPGVVDARRYVAAEGSPKYLALYDLTSPQVLESAPYKALSLAPEFSEEDRQMLRRFQGSMRAVLTQIYPNGVTPPRPPASGAVLVVGLEPEPAYEEEYNAWYDEEHIPMLLPVPGVLRARRFRAIEGLPRYLAVYDLTEPSVRHSAAFEQAIDTPWSTRMRRHCTRRVTAIYRPLPQAGEPQAAES